MKPAATCPSEKVLKALNRGQLPPEHIERLARHLEKCPNCIKTLQGLKDDDNVLQALRRHAGKEKHDPVVDRLVYQLSRLKGRAPGDTASEAETVAPPAAGAPEIGDLLAPPQQPGEIGRLEKYRVLRRLGEGGMGMVFEAEDPQLKRRVALKVMKPGLAQTEIARQRFLREAQAAASIKHDHIVTIYQVGEDRGVPFLAMEFLEGMSLADRLQQPEKLDVPFILRVGREIADGLAAAHERGLIHRDMKPGNVWIEAPRQRVKILDFGLARPAETDEQLTQEGMIVGTPGYMAPEQAEAAVVDERSDLFALGCILYRLCTGQAPFQGATTLAVLLAVCNETPAKIRALNPAIPVRLANLVERLLAKDPEERPRSAIAVIAAIEAIEGDFQTTQTWASPSKQAPDAPRRRRWLLAGLGGVGAIVVVAAVCFIARKQSATRDEGATDIATTPIGAEVSRAGARPSDAGQIASGPPAFEQWGAWLAQLRPGLQIEAVMKKLRELNPAFDGKETHTAVDGTGVSELGFCSDGVTDLRPVGALRHLKSLVCAGSGRGGTRSALTDLTPLAGLHLSTLDCSHTSVADLTAVADMRLSALACQDTRITNLNPLRGMPLEELTCDFQRERDSAVLNTLWSLRKINGQPAALFWEKLDPKRAAYVQWLEATVGKPTSERIAAVVAAFAERNPEYGQPLKPVLKGSSVAGVIFVADQVIDLSPLRALPWTKKGAFLRCSGHWPRKGKLIDLSPLLGLPLEVLDCRDNPGIRNLTPLRLMPLAELDCGQTGVRDLSPLHRLRLRHLECYYSAVKDLAALEGMPLVSLNIGGCHVPTLEPLHGMPLESLGLKDTHVKDLSPLAGLPLRSLECTLMQLPDLAPLRLTCIRDFSCDHPERHTASLARVWTLQKINDQSALDFFRAHDPSHADLLQWLAHTRRLQPQHKIELVKAKLKERNLGLDVTRLNFAIIPRAHTPRSKEHNPKSDAAHGKGESPGESLVGLTIPSQELTDLVPVRALPDLRALDCSGTASAPGKLCDLLPLIGLTRLERLNVAHTAVADLTPLCGVGLVSLHCEATAVHDLAPLRYLPLEEIFCDDPVALANRQALKAIGTLRFINGKPVSDFWRDIDGNQASAAPSAP